MTEQERTLIAGCVKGDKVAWDAFVRQYSKLVYHTIRQTLTLHHTDRREDVVDELHQEFFIAILQNKCRKLSQFRGDGGCTLASFLRVVVVRLTIDLLRKPPTPTVEVTESLASGQPDAADSLIDREEQKSLSRALETLSPRDRLIVQLSYHQSLPADEVAAILGMSVGAIYTQKSRLLARLREVLK